MLNENKDNRDFILEEQLKAYTEKGLYPFHMPGHKRLTAPAPSLPFMWDMTEVDGVDDLHHSEGILKDAMERTAELFGAEHTRYLVNGSTVGLLAGIRAAAPYGCEIAAARNCHKAVYHAIELLGLRVHWLFPGVSETGIQCSIEPSAVMEVLDEHPGIRLFVITSPTYEGVVSDIRKIADLCHSRNVTLLVDEAHGAHLGLEKRLSDKAPYFPESSVHNGADIVIQSAHKTLPSLTQTALLHLPFGSRIGIEEIEKELDVFETSSPSYPLMASLDGCTGIIINHGKELFMQWANRLERFDMEIKALQKLKVLCHGRDCLKDHDGVYGFDPGKIVIVAKDLMIQKNSMESIRLTGAALADILRERYGMETEMHLGDYVLAMTSMCDSEDALDRLAKALLEIDSVAYISDVSENLSEEGSSTIGADTDVSDASIINSAGITLNSAAFVMTVKEALEKDSMVCSKKQAKGKVAGEYVYCYPPGIPVIVPGELITENEIDTLDLLEKKGCRVFHSGSRMYTDIKTGKDKECFVIVS